MLTGISIDLSIVRKLLIQRFGPEFCYSAVTNQDHHVAAPVVRALSAPPPSAAALDAFLERIAQIHGVNWFPEPQRHDM